MALETGGLDAQIEQRMDAYRGNPQKLQQRYGANKELLDLLALQKLTSEKQAAARDMQMKMQQQPGTIAQQREQQALDLTKQQTVVRFSCGVKVTIRNGVFCLEVKRANVVFFSLPLQCAFF